MSRPIVFLSDFGLHDEFVGICHGVIARAAPAVRVIDLTHAIPPGSVLRGALVLAESIRYMPEDAIFLAVVDPGVGTARRPVAIRIASGQSLVGPDNGLLSVAWKAMGGVTEAFQVAAPEVVLSPVSATFHGRDVFAPAAAHLALGRPMEELGTPIDPNSLVRVDVPTARVSRGEVVTEVLGVDRFGNAQLAARPEDLAAAGLAQAGPLDLHASGVAASVRQAATFGGVEEGGLALIVDSTGWLAIAVNGGSASETLQLRPGDAVNLSRRAK